MNILILHSTFSYKDRKTITDHLYSFKRYAGGHRYYYLDVQKPKDVSRLIQRMPFDGVIFHYTFLSRRYDQALWQLFYGQVRERLAAVQGCKVALPQDEYHFTASLRQLFCDVGIDHIFSIAREENFDIIFPPEIVGANKCSAVLTGYVDKHDVALVEKLRRKTGRRTIDIGYRGRGMTYSLGRHGLLKRQIVEYFNRALGRYPDLTGDISNTGDRKNTILGRKWLAFLLRCRVMPGCLGGSSILDVDGAIAARVNAYLKTYPDASFDEVEAACFPGEDGRIEAHMLSPRHFECAITKTCQVLVEDDYHGIMQPGVHYIELKRDFSNLDEVMEKIRDKAFCEQIAQRCYDDLVGSAQDDNPNTYAWFARHITGYIAAHLKSGANSPGALMRIRCRMYCAYVHKRTRAAKWLYGRCMVIYTAMCRFLSKHPGAKRAAQKVLKKPFDEI